MGAPHPDGKPCNSADCQQWMYTKKQRKRTPKGDIATPETELLPNGGLAGVGFDPNFATFDQRHLIEDDGDYYIPDGMRHLYDNAEQRIYHRDRNQLMAARQMLNGSTRPPNYIAKSRQGWIMAAFGNNLTKKSRYFEPVDPTLESNQYFPERNY